jgi:hypothetical protein
MVFTFPLGTTERGLEYGRMVREPLMVCQREAQMEPAEVAFRRQSYATT